MEKWANYCIKSVHYDNDHSRIDSCEVLEDLGDNFGNSSTQKKSIIVSNLKKNLSYMTIYENSENKYRKGDNVITYVMENEDFIRTDGNKIKKDNLGELPEF
jgi:hypothetical protein